MNIRMHAFSAERIPAVWLIILTLSMGGCDGRRTGSDHPNLLFVFADQLRKQAVGYMDEDPVRTPNLDRLAAEGVAFTNAVSSCPICSPYRAMLMTGRYPISTGITSNCMPGTDLSLDTDELCIGDVLKVHGYATGYIGKWHLEAPSLNGSPSPPDSAVDAWDGWTPPGARRHGFDFWYADWRTTGYRGLKTERYTYVVQRGEDGSKQNRYLYDNLEDPYQLSPIRATFAEEDSIMLRLDGELQEWLFRMHDPFPL